MVLPMIREQSARSLLEVSGIWKSFNGVPALRDVDIAFAPGTIHALLGENGAGKSTSMNIAGGLLRPDAGRVLVDGREHQIRTPRDALALGIGMVHQNLRLIGDFTVAETIHLGWDETPRIVSHKSMQAGCEEQLARVGTEIDARALVRTLSMAERQQVAIVRALSRGARILILDEPTSLLAPPEADKLAEIARRLADSGTAIVFISHKLPEVLALADTITVMRGGSVVASGPCSDFDAGRLTRLMVGGEIAAAPIPAGRPSGEVALECRDLTVTDDHGRDAVNAVSLALRAGEIVGVAAVSGNGQRELAEALAGVRPTRGGEILVRGTTIDRAGARDFISAGVGYLPDDPEVGLPPATDIAAGALMRAALRPPVRRGALLSRRRGAEFVERLLGEAGLAKVDPNRRAATLSGGQAQRIMFRRELESGKLALITMHPTRGLDVGASRAVHRMLADARDRGTAILLVSEDLDELLDLSDRVNVIFAGRLVGSLSRTEFDRARIGAWMAGLEPAPA